MGNVYYCIPSARPPAEAEKCLSKWRAQGYSVAIVVDNKADADAKHDMADIIISASPEGYRGYAQSVNGIVELVLGADKSCDWVVTGGDDTYPDPTKDADTIARECSAHFHNHMECMYPPNKPKWAWDLVFDQKRTDMTKSPWATFGVMQPTGDLYADRSIERICGSPWMGREFCKRIYGGNGPLWPEFTHMFVDQHLQEVATKLGILWQRPDLTHHHEHFQRQGDYARTREVPPHLVKWNTGRHWAESKAIFERLKAGGFAEANDLLT